MLDFEAYVDAAAAALKTDGLAPLLERIAAANDAHDDFELPTIDDERILPGGEDPIGPPFPLVELAVPDFTLTGFSLGQSAADAAPQVAVRAWVEDAIYQQLWRSVYRFADCVLDALAQRGAFGEGVTVATVRGGFGLDPETGARQEFRGSAVLVFTLDDVALG